MKSPQITFEDYQAMASLLYDKGYILLLEYIQSHLDDLTSELASCEENYEKSKNLLAKWRAHRELFAILSTAPQNFANEVKDQQLLQEQTLGPQLNRRIHIQKTEPSPTELAHLKQLYEAKTGKKLDLGV